MIAFSESDVNMLMCYVTDDSVEKFSKFADWNCLSTFYGETATIGMIRQYHRSFRLDYELSCEEINFQRTFYANYILYLKMLS